jgi:hypothetical protein
MSIDFQLTLPGSLSETNAKTPTDKINIDLDNKTGKYGHAIGWDLFKSIVKRFHNERHLRPKEKTSYVIDKQILHILMSSSKCTSLLLSKCMREDGHESIAFTALDKKGMPLGIKIDSETKQSTLSKGSSETFSGEWIQGLTVDDEKNAGIWPGHGVESTFDFERYIEAIQSQGGQLAQDFL